MEKARLSEKMPRDVKYLTKTEAELKRELVLCIEEAEDLMTGQKRELQRLRREHYEQQTVVSSIQQTQDRVKGDVAEI